MMKRIPLSSIDTIVSFDKKVFEQYRNKDISKSLAMKLIAENNGAESIPEEYFDYLVKNLGYSRSIE